MRTRAQDAADGRRRTDAQNPAAAPSGAGDLAGPGVHGGEQIAVPCCAHFLLILHNQGTAGKARRVKKAYELLMRHI